MHFIDLQTQYQLIQNEVKQRINQVLEHGQYIMGPEITELEIKLADFVGSQYAIGVASGTDALLMALMALDVGVEDEVITTPFSFVATIETIALLRAKPVFVDVDKHTRNLDPALIEAAITPKTKAILAVSLYGQCADFKAINQIAEKYNLLVIEDAAQSFGAMHYNQHSCNLTTIGCTSFFPSKPLGCYGDGGACFTNDANLAQAMREIRIHGQAQRYHHTRLGINGRLDSIQAAILLAKLPIFPGEIELRQQVASYYQHYLPDNVVLPYILPNNKSVYAQYTIQVVSREIWQQQFQQHSIPTAIHYPLPLHLQPGFAYLGLQQGDFPVAENLAKQVLSLPMHPYLSKEQVKEISVVAEKIVTADLSV